MSSHKEALSFGHYLQSIRLEKKISLEKISAQTRIGLENLLLIEQEDLERLPAAVFVKGFIRAYAAAIGADGDEAVHRYVSRLNVVQKIAESEGSIGKAAPRFWLKLLFSLTLLLGIIVFSIYGLSYYRHQPEEEESVEQTEYGGSDHPRPPESETQTERQAESDTVSAKAIPDKFLLKVTALEDTWLKVIIDEKDPREYSLKAGDAIELEATAGYNLLIGNAGGLKITLNNEPVLIPGESGQVVNLYLP